MLGEHATEFMRRVEKFSEIPEALLKLALTDTIFSMCVDVYLTSDMSLEDFYIKVITLSSERSAELQRQLTDLHMRTPAKWIIVKE